MYIQKTVISDENNPEIGQSYSLLNPPEVNMFNNKIITALK